MANSTSTAPCVRIALDIRGLPPPEPMQRVFEALARLPPTGTLVVQSDCQLFLLYEMLEADGWSRSIRWAARNHWEICIWRPEEVL